MLQQGATGEEVRKLQTSLQGAGFDVGPIDAQFGPRTASALKAYQSSKGLVADAIFGPKTSASLYGTNPLNPAGYVGGTVGGAIGSGPITSSNGKSPLDLAKAIETQQFYNTDTGSLTEAGKAKGLPENPYNNQPTTGVGTSTVARNEERAKEIARIKEELSAGTKAPALFKSVDEFKKLREEQGVVKDEDELASIRNEASLGNQELRQFKSKAGEGVSEAGRIGAVSEAERNLNFRLEGLAIREQAVLNRVNTKNAYINTLMQLGEQDYNNAYTEYTNEYNKNVKAIDLYNKELDDNKKDALTGFTTITNLLSKSGLSTLDPSLSTQLDSLALQAGLPTGVFQSALQGLTAKEKIDNMKVVDNKVYLQTTDASGNPHLKLLQTLPESGSGTGEAGSADTKGGKYYVIKQGDTLNSIANKLGLTVDVLRKVNPGIAENNLQVGQKLSTDTSKMIGKAQELNFESL